MSADRRMANSTLSHTNEHYIEAKNEWKRATWIDMNMSQKHKVEWRKAVEDYVKYTILIRFINMKDHALFIDTHL